MKQLLILALSFTTACNSIQQDKTEAFIPGTYVKHFDDQYFKDGEDTLIVTKSNEDGNVYSIARHMSYQKVVDQKLQPREYKSENWIGVYNEKEKVLHEQKHGATISFSPEKNSLTVGTNDYKKIK